MTDETPAAPAPQAPGSASSPGREGEVGGEAHEAGAGRTGLRDAIAEALRDRINQAPQRPSIDGPTGLSEIAVSMGDLANVVMQVVGPAIERVHLMTDACDELLVRERTAHAKTARQVDIERGRGNTWANRTIRAEAQLEQHRAAVQRVRALITCDPVEDHHDHVCPDTVLVTDVLAALGLAVLVAKPADRDGGTR